MLIYGVQGFFLTFLGDLWKVLWCCPRPYFGTFKCTLH